MAETDLAQWAASLEQHAPDPLEAWATSLEQYEPDPLERWAATLSDSSLTAERRKELDERAKLLASDPTGASGVLEWQTASDTRPWEYDYVEEKFAKELKKAKPAAKLSLKEKAAAGALRGIVGLGEMVLAKPGGLPQEVLLDDDQTLFRKRLNAIRGGLDPLVDRDAPWYKRGIVGAAEEAPSMITSLAAGGVAGSLARAAKLGSLGVNLAQAAGVGSVYYKRMRDDTYFELLGKGISKEVAGRTAAVSAIIQSAIEGLVMPNPFARRMGSKAVSKTMRGVILSKLLGFTGEGSEEFFQSMSDGLAKGIVTQDTTAREVLATSIKDTLNSLPTLTFLMGPGMVVGGTAEAVNLRARGQRLKELKATRATEPKNLKRRAAEVGITGTRSEVRKTLDAEIQQAEQGIKDAQKVPGDQTVAEKTGEVGQRGEEDRGRNVRRPGKVEGGEEPTVEVPPAPEAQVEPTTEGTQEETRRPATVVADVAISERLLYEEDPIDLDQLDVEVARLEELAKRGKLTPVLLSRSNVTRGIGLNTQGELNSELRDGSAQEMVAALRDQVDSRRSRQQQPPTPAQEAPVEPATETATAESDWQRETRERLDAVPAFENSQFELDEEAGTVKVARPDGRRTTIHLNEDAKLDALAKKRGKKGAKGAYVRKLGKKGEFQEGDIYLRSDSGHDTLNHEVVHWLTDEGVVTAEEVDAHGGREEIAKAYGRWAADQQRKPNTVFERIYDFLENIFSSRAKLFADIGKRGTHAKPKPAPAPVASQSPTEAAPTKEAPTSPVAKETPQEAVQGPEAALEKAGINVKKTEAGWTVTGISQEQFDAIREDNGGRKRGRNFTFKQDPSESLADVAAEIANRTPKKRSETAKERKEAAKERFQEAARRLTDPTKLTMGLDPSKVKAAVDMALAAMDYGIASFDEFISLAIESLGEQGVRDHAPYLEEAAKQTGVQNVTSVAEAMDKQPPKSTEETVQEPVKATDTKNAKTDRPDFTGIKRERLEMQADAAGKPRPTEVEAVNAVELVENAVANLTPESDLKTQELAAEVVATKKPITVEQTADLLASVDYHRRKADEAEDRYNEHMKNGEEAKAKAAETEESIHRAAMNNVAQAARDVGRRQFAYMGHVLQVLVDKDGAAHIERLLRKANNGRLDESDVAWAKELAEGLEKAKKEQARRGKEIADTESTKAADEKKTELEGELKRERTQSPRKRGSGNRIVTEKAKDDAVKRIRDRIKKLKTTASAVGAGDALAMLPDAAIVAGYHVEAGARKLADFSRAMIADLGDWVKPHLAELHRTARAEYAKARQEELRNRLTDAEDLQGQHRSVGQLAKEILAETRKEDGSFISRDELLQRLHDELKKIDPDITLRETRDLFSGYGKYEQLSDDDLEVAYRDRKGESRALGQLDDLASKQAPKATGRQQHEPSDEERRLTREVRELKKQGERDGWYHSGDSGKKLKGTLESTKTRLRNEISDLEDQLESGTKTARKRSEPLTDAEKEALVKQRDALKERLDAVVRASEELDLSRWETEGGAIVDPAVEQYLKVLDRQIRALEKELASEDVFPRPVRVRPGGQAVDVRKARIEALQAEKAKMRKTLDPEYETNQKLKNAEKAAEREVARLEKERAQGFKMKEKPTPLPVSDKLRKARARLTALREQRMEALEDEYALKAAIAQSKRNAANIADRLARGDFAPRKRRPARVWDDPQWKEAKKDELEKRRQLATKVAEYEWEHSEFIDKAGYWTRLALALHKAWIVSFDASFLGLQSGFAFYTNTRQFVESLMPSARAMANDDSRALIDAERVSHPDYAEAKRLGVALSEHGEKGDTTTTEFFPTDKIVDAVPGVAFSERGFSTFMNELRFRVWQALSFSYSKPDGRQLNDETGKALASLVNTLTFAWRPKSQKGRNVLAGAAYAFWAPSMYVARLHIITAMPVWKNRGADMRIRKIAAQQLIKGYTGMALTYMLFQWLWGDDDDEFDLRSADTGKVAKGDTRVDVTSGLAQNAVLLERIRTGKMFTSAGEERDADLRRLFATFGGYKLNPAIQFALSAIPLALGRPSKDVIGRPVTWGSLALDNLTPLSIQTATEALEEHDVLGATALSVLGAIGKNVQIYDTQAPKSEETLLATVQRLFRKMEGAEPPGLEEEGMEKWLSTIDWKTDLSKAAKYLNPEQLGQAEKKLKERKEDVVHGVRPKPELPRKRGYTPAAYRKEEGKLPERVEEWEKGIAKFQEMRQSLNLSYEKAQEMLVKYYWQPTKKGKLGSEQNAYYPNRAKALDELYGKPKGEYKKWRVKAGFTDEQRKQKRAEWRAK